MPDDVEIMSSEEPVQTPVAVPNDSPVAVPIEQSVMPNLAKTTDKGTLEKIGQTVCDDFDSDLRSRSDWDASRVSWMKLFSGKRDKKNFPWEGCSNIHIPLLAEACIQFQARSLEALLPPKEYAKCFATDGISIDRASRASKYMNYQLTEKMEEWEEDMDITLLQVPLNGSAYKKTYYDPALKRVVSRYLGVENFVTPYKCKRIEDAPRKTHCYYEEINDIKKKEEIGFFIKEEIDSVAETQLDKPSPAITEQADKGSGVTPSGNDNLNLVFLLEQHRRWDLNNDGIEEEYIVTVDYATRKVKRIEERTYREPVTGEEKVDEYFTAYTFIPNPDSHYAFGFGHFLEGLNESGNTIVNQLIDAGTLANAGGGLINRRSGLKTGKIVTSPGVYTPVDIPVNEIRNAIYQWEFKEPSNVLFMLLGLIKEYAGNLTTVSDAMMGKLPPSDTTATTMLAVMEQGLKVFSTIHKRQHRSFKKELKKIFKLNSRYLNEKEYYVVQDSTSREFKTLESGREDFGNMIDVIPSSDPSITSRAEKLIKSKQAYEVGIGNPLIMNNPEAMYELTYAFYQSIEQPNIDKILKKPEPQGPPNLPSMEENALLLQEKPIDPHPDQDHLQHLQDHENFKNSMWAEQLTPMGKKMLEQHMMKTLSYLYISERQRQDEQSQIESMGGMNAGPGFDGGGAQRMVSPGTYAKAISSIGATG